MNIARNIDATQWHQSNSDQHLAIVSFKIRGEETVKEFYQNSRGLNGWEGSRWLVWLQFDRVLSSIKKGKERRTIIERKTSDGSKSSFPKNSM